jgi:hypothetical protein
MALIKFLRKTFLVFATLLVSTALLAGDFPNYPPEKWCKEVSDAAVRK